MFLFGLLVLIGLIGISLWSFRLGLVLYLITALIFPTLPLGKTAFRIELVYSLWLIILKIIRSSKFKLKTENQGLFIPSLYALLFVIMTFSTLLAWKFNSGLPIGAAPSGSVLKVFAVGYGFLRPLIVMLLFLNTPFDERWKELLLTTLLLLSIPISVLSIGQSTNLPIAQQITQNWFTSPYRTAMPVVQKQWGFILRSTGVFEYHGYNAIFSLTVILIAGYLLINGLEKKTKLILLYLSLALSAGAGVLSVSVTFLLGIPIVVLLLLFSARNVPQGLPRFLRTVAVILGVIILLLLPIITRNPDIGQGLRNQMGRILDGDFLRGRYHPKTGKLAQAYQAIAQRPLLGWGFVRKDTFVGDSLYVSLLYHSGIIGLGLWVIFIGLVLVYSWGKRKKPFLNGKFSCLIFLITLLYSVVGFGSPSFFILRLEEWYWALLGLSLVRLPSSKQEYKL